MGTAVIFVVLVTLFLVVGAFNSWAVSGARRWSWMYAVPSALATAAVCIWYGFTHF